MFQIGLVERPGQVAEPAVAETTKVVMGQPLTNEEEDKLVFGDLDKL